jgi:predicted GNAT superfamily acetyltransferase
MGNLLSRKRRTPLADQDHVVVGKHVVQSPLINPASVPTNPHQFNASKYEWRSASGSEINHWLEQGYTICDPQTQTHVWMRKPNHDS